MIRFPSGASASMCFRLALSLLVVTALAACGKKEAPPPALRPVVAVAIQSDGQPPRATLPGQIEPRYSTPLSFRVGGKIIERRVRLGDAVKAGQIVARLDPADASKNAASAARATRRRAASARLREAAARSRPGAGGGEPDRAGAAGADAERVCVGARAARSGAAASRPFRRSIEVHHARRRSRGRHHRRSRPTPGRTSRQARPSTTSRGTATSTWSATCPKARWRRSRSAERANVTLAALPGKAFTARVRELSPAADPQSRTYRAKLTHRSADARRAPWHDRRRHVRASGAGAQRRVVHAARHRAVPRQASSPPCGS